MIELETLIEKMKYEDNSYIRKYGLLDYFVEEEDIFEFSFFNSDRFNYFTIFISGLVSLNLIGGILLI